MDWGRESELEREKERCVFFVNFSSPAWHSEPPQYLGFL